MKKNAILVAAILFINAGANARAQSDYSDDYSDLNARGRTIQNTENINRTPQGAPAPSEMATSSQYDPASVNRFRADSSIRGGSNEARGLRNYGRTDYDTSSHPMNPPVKADSSIRGSSNEARGYDRRNWQSSTDSSSSDLNSRSDDDGELYLFFFKPEEGQGGAGEYDSGSASNWNPSDDLLKDNEQSQNLTDHERQLLEQDRQERSSMLDDMDTHTGSSAQYETGNDSMPNGGLNSSRNLAKNIRGEYNLEDQVDTSNPDQPGAGQLSPG